jgi:uncharacterized protein (DUF433 family)
MARTLPTTPAYPHVNLDAAGVPVLAGTTMKVVELVMAQQAYGWSSEELHFQHPNIPLSHIYSALAYYWDHREARAADGPESGSGDGRGAYPSLSPLPVPPPQGGRAPPPVPLIGGGGRFAGQHLDSGCPLSLSVGLPETLRASLLGRPACYNFGPGRGL